MAALPANAPSQGEQLALLPEFLADVLGPDPGARCVFDLQRKQHVWANDNAGLVHLIEDRRADQGIYFGTAVFQSQGSRAASNVAARKVFCLDIDAGPEKHAKHGGAVYASRQAALVGLIDACKALGMPPAWIVASGPHGLHAYFCLAVAVPPAEWVRVAAKFKRTVKLTGLRADDAVTADAARVLRPPGAFHSSGALVTVLKRTAKVYALAEFEGLLDACLEAHGPGADVIDLQQARARVPGERPRNAQLMMPLDDGMTEHAAGDLLAALQHLAAVGFGATYEEWASVGHALKTLDGTDWGDRAQGLWLDYSRTCPGYVDDADVLRKWGELRGERTHWRAVFTIARDRGWRTRAADVQQGTGAEAPTGQDDDARPTDLALAEIWGRREAHHFRHDHARGAWMHHDGGTWRGCDKGQHVESFKVMASDLRRAAAAALIKAGGNESETAKAKRYLACADRAQSATGTRAALSLAQSSPAIAVTFDEFDRDPELFNVANGVVHLPSGTLRAHDPALMLHRQSPVPFDPRAECPRFMEFMRQASCDDADWVSYVQRTLGYCLSGYVHEERALFWLGSGANGKSVLANLCRHIWGTYAASAPTSFLMQARREAGAATPELAMLPGVRLLMANEVEAGSRLSAQTLKVAVSTEHIAARPLYGNPFSFKPTHKVIVRGNHRPIIADDDEGIWRRIDLVPFDLNLTQDQRDPGLEARLIDEAPGILAWAVRGFAAWKREGLRQCRRVRDASLAYRKDSDLLGQWLDEACDVGEGFDVPQRHAYGVFRQWCQEQGLRQPSKKTFTRNLRERGLGERRESTGTRAELYTGMRLKQ